MLRPLVSVLLVALAASAGAQVRGSGPSAKDVRNPISANGFTPAKAAHTSPVAKAPRGGVRGATPVPAGPDAAWVASLRARHELAKANGQLCPIREARQAARLAQLEAQLAVKGPPSKSHGMMRGGLRGKK